MWLALPRYISTSVKRIKSDVFYRYVLMFTTASLVASVLNYLYYPVMGRLIGVDSYGELQVVTSFILQLTTVFVSLNLINVNVIANHDEAEAPVLMAALQKAIFWLVVALCVLLSAASGFLQSYFHFTSVWPFLLIIPVLLIDTVSVYWTGFLQGHRDFFSLSAYSITTATGKLVVSTLLVLLGFSVVGGVLGISIGLAISLALIRLTASKPLPKLRQAIMWPTKSDRALIRNHLVFIIEVIIGLLSMSVVLSIDVILVKHLFPAQFAGQYAGVATIARIIFFASAPIVTVMLPSITSKDPKKSNIAFLRALSLSAAICAAGLIVFALFPRLLITLMLGKAFAVSSSWLPYLGVVATLSALTNLMVNYLLAIRSHWAMVVSLASLLTAIPLILLHHATVPQIVLSASAGLFVGQLIFWLVYFVSARRKA